MTAAQLRSFLTDEKKTLESISKMLATFNLNEAPKPELAGHFLADESGTPILLSVGFLGSEQTSRAKFCYNLSGEIEMRLDSRIHQGTTEAMHSSWFNKSLTQKEVDAIVQLAKLVEKNYFYSTLAVPLAFCRYARRAEQRNEATDFAELHHFFASHGVEVLTNYRGGACFTLAEFLRDQIRQQVGVEAYVVSRLEENLIARWPRLDGVGTEVNESVYELLGPHTHTDVVVPYVQDGVKKHVHIAVGMGADYTSPALNHIDHFGENPENKDIEAYYLARDGIIANPERLAAQGIRCKPKIFMKNPKNDAIFGLDLIGGHLYINTKAQKTLENAEEGTHVVEKIVSFENQGPFVAALIRVEKLFGMEPEFTEDVIYLMNNRDSYLEKVLLPPAANLAFCRDVYSDATRWAAEKEKLVYQFRRVLPGANIGDNRGMALLSEASTAVRESSREEARSLYGRAAVELRIECERLQSALSEDT